MTKHCSITNVYAIKRNLPTIIIITVIKHKIAIIESKYLVWTLQYYQCLGKSKSLFWFLWTMNYYQWDHKTKLLTYDHIFVFSPDNRNGFHLQFFPHQSEYEKKVINLTKHCSITNVYAIKRNLPTIIIITVIKHKIAIIESKYLVWTLQYYQCLGKSKSLFWFLWTMNYYQWDHKTKLLTYDHIFVFSPDNRNGFHLQFFPHQSEYEKKVINLTKHCSITNVYAIKRNLPTIIIITVIKHTITYYNSYPLKTILVIKHCSIKNDYATWTYKRFFE